MPFYIYKCMKCNKTFDAIKMIKDRNNPSNCPECGSESKRQFDPSAGSIIMWKEPNANRATCSGPTRKMRYTVQDVADENNWWDKWKIKRSEVVR